MKSSSDSSFSFQKKKREELDCSLVPRKIPRKNIVTKAFLRIKTPGVPLISKSTGECCECIVLEPYKSYAVGRSLKLCEFIFPDRRVSRKHCQLFFDSLNKKIYLSDGVFFSCSEGNDSFSRARVRVSLNGVFVNGVKISGAVELHAGDEVWLVCGNEEACGMGDRIGFFMERIVCLEEVDQRSLIKLNSGSVYWDYVGLGMEHSGIVDKMNEFSSMCRDVLCSDDPVSHIRKCLILDCRKRDDCAFKNGDDKNSGLLSDNDLGFCKNGRLEIECGNRKRVYSNEGEAEEKCDGKSQEEIILISKENTKLTYIDGAANVEAIQQLDNGGINFQDSVIASENSDCSSLEFVEKDGFIHCRKVLEDKNKDGYIPPPGKKFYLNRLQFRSQDLPDIHNTVSLPELLHPVDSLIRVFIATFTSDILWFLSYCKIPCHLPVTIACHSAEGCWSLDPDKRTSIPFSDFPNLTIVHPLFPEEIAFGKDRNNSGIACHHPKLIVLQREDSLRVAITSANLVAKQWHCVTNTVWWQDFPRLDTANYLSLFTQFSNEEINMDSNSDFAAQLAGFMATLLADVPSQAHWIMELPKYNFEWAVGYLIASVPGIYSRRSPCISESKHLLAGNKHIPESCGLKLLGSLEASVVGLSHIYRASADSKGAQLKKLASFLGKCDEDLHGMSEIVLRRDTNIPADRNAVSVLIPNPEDFSTGDFIQLGFLPRHVAKWVAPLSDIGFFMFSAYIYPKEVLATALEGINKKVTLILYVYLGPSFFDISKVTQLEYVSGLCSLVASIQRCAGLWRLNEVLGQFKWPEHLESEFFFGSSSVGSVNPQFLAAFSAAAGKRSLPFSESEESDPDWGCWSASQELKNPSIRIVFPTIKRVKNTRSGILASKRLLCFSQKTWQKLKNAGILHDAIPYPSGRVGLPMHVKVGCRRFRSKTDASSFGWVYCGSHNFSAAAWGRPISNSLDRQANGNSRNNPVLGSRLHISNYELGIIFIVPPPDTVCVKQKSSTLDDIVLPFVVPPPKYGPGDAPATAQAMREALAELMEQEREKCEAATAVQGWIEEEIPEEEEEEIVETAQYVTMEKEDEKAYADKLWSQVESSESS
ncbi:forkhead-associated domain-containing protein/FHA domain-containing protein [Forsythia ovata]|uniref:Forkhead-associated domain-containing protein/FHA domain-containing protein n=1 Tax=Forsythia ovata TaxID=205694 RepID=A0ABD1WYQ0_9LAMI